jgi:Zn finger protein HypA/HybF involved in hydrogenase expression
MEGQAHCKCPSCKKTIELDLDLAVGDITYCPECFESLKISGISPFRVEVSEEEDEWNDEDESEEEDE